MGSIPKQSVEPPEGDTHTSMASTYPNPLEEGNANPNDEPKYNDTKEVKAEKSHSNM